MAARKPGSCPRLAFVVSHPIQYYAPLHQRLAARNDVNIKVFFTWHAGSSAVHDRGFGIPIAWDIPLTSGYDFELVENTSFDPGTHHFSGLQNPSLVRRVLAWQPHAVHLTGWAWRSHLSAMRAFRACKLPTLFRGDSHLLDEKTSGPRWLLKKEVLRRIYRWPAAILVTGAANLAYYRAFGVQNDRLIPCPHSIDVARFAEPAATYEHEARRWRTELGISPDKIVVLFAGKFEPKKKPIELMKAVEELDSGNVVAIMVGGGELHAEMDTIAKKQRNLFRILPFQNQSRMPVVYRLADLFVLPSAFGETWGLAVNEALACGRPVLVSDKVGCAQDVAIGAYGKVFSYGTANAMRDALSLMTQNKERLEALRDSAAAKAREYDLSITEEILMHCLSKVRT